VILDSFACTSPSGGTIRGWRGLRALSAPLHRPASFGSPSPSDREPPRRTNADVSHSASVGWSCVGGFGSRGLSGRPHHHRLRRAALSDYGRLPPPARLRL